MSWVMKAEVKGTEEVSETRGPNRRYLTYGLVGFGALLGVRTLRDG